MPRMTLKIHLCPDCPIFGMCIPLLLLMLLVLFEDCISIIPQYRIFQTSRHFCIVMPWNPSSVQNRPKSSKIHPSLNVPIFGVCVHLFLLMLPAHFEPRISISFQYHVFQTIEYLCILYASERFIHRMSRNTPKIHHFANRPIFDLLHPLLFLMLPAHSEPCISIIAHHQSL